MFDSFSRSFGSPSARAAEADEAATAGSPFGAVASYMICGCCGRFHSVVETGDGGQGAILNGDDRGGFGPNGKPSLTPADAGIQITRSNSSWATGLGQAANVTFAFRASAATMPTDTAGFSQFTTAQIQATLLALAAWSDVANITFTRVNDSGSQYSNNATILFGNYSSGQDGAAAFAYLPGGMPGSTNAGAAAGDVWINSSEPYNANPVMQGYGHQVLLHEIGHALGLSHPAAYNASEGVSITYGANATYFEDSRQYTVMSYFSEQNTGADFRTPTGTNRYSAVPLLDDIAAAQRLYGANMSARTGDTVYGFNSNAGQPWFSATSAATALIFAVWDAGGTDTFDFSGYSVAQTLDLRQGAFSSVGGLVGNVAIAIGAVIENVIGGTGADQIRGNSAANVITGNGGQDVIDGGLGSDTVVFAGPRADYTITWNGRTGTVTAAGQAPVTVTNVEFLRFSDQTVAAAPTGGIVVAGDITNDTATGTAFADTIGGLGGADALTGLGGDDLLDGGSGDDVLNGGDGDDHLTGGLGADSLTGGTGFDVADYGGATGGVTVNLTSGTASGAAGADTLSGVEEVRGSIHADTLTGDAAANILRGGGGIDTLNGGGGNDQLFSGNPGETGGAPDILKLQSTANGSIAAAVSLVGGFDLGTRSDVANANSIPHATVQATTHGGMEYYAFTVAAGDTVVFDIDNAAFDSVLRVFDGAGNQLAQNDDSASDGGPATDSNLSHTFASAGTYYIQVSRWQSGSEGEGTLVTAAPAAGLTYTLHVSIPSATVVPLEYRGATMNGDAGVDTLDGGIGRDTMNGGADDDTFTGRGGNDQIDGGTGTDTAVYFGSRSDYTITVSNGVTTISGGSDGTDTLVNVERIKIGNLYYDAAGQPLPLQGTANADTLYGTDGADTINGLDGDDVIWGQGGDDVIDGGVGTDTARFADVRSAYTISSASGVTTVTGPHGTDTITNVERLEFADGLYTPTGAPWSTTIDGTPNADTLNGTAEAETISGGDGDDVIAGGGGADTISGGAGVDTAVFSGLRSAHTVTTSGATTTVSGPGGTATVTTVERLRFDDVTLIVGAGGGQYFAGTPNVDAITGTAFNDEIDGGDGGDVINALGGSDLVRAGGGDDQVTAGSGTDRLFGGAGGDRLEGDSGDQLWGEDGDDMLVAVGSTGSASILLAGAAGVDTAVLRGTSAQLDVATGVGVVGATAIAGSGLEHVVVEVQGGGARTVSGNGAANRLSVGASDDGASGATFDGRGGDDVLTGGAAADVLIGGAGLDVLYGRGDGDDLQGEAGDQLYGEDGDDLLTVTGSAATATVVAAGASGTDTLVLRGSSAQANLATGSGTVGSTAVTLSGIENVVVEGAGAGMRTITGNGAANRLSVGSSGAGTFNVTFDGAAGDDVLSGAGGDDVLIGGAGIDTADYSGASAGMRAQLNSGTAVNDGDGGSDSLSGIENLTGSAFDDILIGDAGVNVLRGGLGRDTLIGLAGDDVLHGGDGVANQLQGGLGADTYYVSVRGDSVIELAGEGTDLVVTTASQINLSAHVENLTFVGTGTFTGVGNAEGNVIRGGAGRDTLIGQGGNDILAGGAGEANNLFGGQGNDYFILQAPDSVIENVGEGTDTVEARINGYNLGANVENLIFGGVGDFNGGGNALNNLIIGGAGNDTLRGGGGIDQIRGGAGGDTIVLRGLAADYTITAEGSGWRILDGSAGRDGSILATDVEWLRFADGSTLALGGASAPAMADGGKGDAAAPPTSPILDDDPFLPLAAVAPPSPLEADPMLIAPDGASGALARLTLQFEGVRAVADLLDHGLGHPAADDPWA